MELRIRNYFRSLEARNLVQTWLNFKGFVIVFGSPLYLEVFQFFLSYLYDIHISHILATVYHTGL